jgi:hypothetical protein
MILAGTGEVILDLAEPLTQSDGNGPPPGEKYGVTAGRLAVVEELWTRYSMVVGAPASARAKRKALTGALSGQFAAVEEQFAELDDLILQFRGSEAGHRFVESWFNARRLTDTGRRAAKAAPASEVAPVAQAA